MLFHQKSRQMLAAALTLLFLSWSPSSAAAADKMPAFDLPQLDGSGNLRLEQVLGKGPVLVNFWASWCKPCLMEAPHLVKLYKERHEEGLEIIAISLDQKGRTEKIKAAVDKYGMNYPVLVDPTSAYASKLKVRSIPMSVLVDAEGNIVRTFEGFYPGIEKEIEREALKLLNKS